MRSRRLSSGVPSPERCSRMGISVATRTSSQEHRAAPNGTFGKDHLKLLPPRVVQCLSSGLCGLDGATGAVAAAGGCVVVGAGVAVVVAAIGSSAEASVSPSEPAAWADAKARTMAAINVRMWCLPFEWSHEVSHAGPFPNGLYGSG